MNFSEDKLAQWARRPSQAETDRMDSAVAAIKKAISASEKLNARQSAISVFPQGSYRNRVNVRADSDVDIAVVYTGGFYWTAPENFDFNALGYGDHPYNYNAFRDDVEHALRSYFKSGVITNGDKAFDVKETSYRVEADVAPFFDHRQYYADGSHADGIEIKPRSGGRIINFPEEHYQNGVAKNAATNKAFKGCVRILKTLRYGMIADDEASEGDTSSFLMECLVYNVPDEHFSYDTWEECLRECLIYLYHNTVNDGLCEEWLEVSELKWLFKFIPGKRAKAHQFVLDCWNYMGFE